MAFSEKSDAILMSGKKDEALVNDIEEKVLEIKILNLFLAKLHFLVLLKWPLE